jgi:hypothetical protein
MFAYMWKTEEIDARRFGAVWRERDGAFPGIGASMQLSEKQRRTLLEKEMREWQITFLS